MPNFIPITDLQDPALDVYTRLTENQLRNRLDPEKGIFIAQTGKVIRLALEAGCEPLSVLAEDQNRSAESEEALALIGDCPVYTAPGALLQKLTGFSLTRGILCAMRRPALPSLEEICRDARRIAVLHGVVDATNIGAIIRSAAALSMDALVVCSNCCDPFNRRAVRVSMGTLFQIPWTIVPEQTWQQDLKALGFQTAALALREDTLSIEDQRLRDCKKLALVLGSEGWGLPDPVIRACDYTVRIPMGHGVDSLNVAAASAVAFWQLRV